MLQKLTHGNDGTIKLTGPIDGALLNIIGENDGACPILIIGNDGA
jgi:hypothetical protein